MADNPEPFPVDQVDQFATIIWIDAGTVSEGRGTAARVVPGPASVVTARARTAPVAGGCTWVAEVSFESLRLSRTGWSGMGHVHQQRRPSMGRCRYKKYFPSRCSTNI